jgi:hypothetical protein
VAYREMLRWGERASMTMDQIEYIKKFHKAEGNEDHNIRILIDDNITRIQRVTEYWVHLAIEPKNRMEELWSTCLKSREKINEAMIDLHLSKFGSRYDF